MRVNQAKRQSTTKKVTRADIRTMAKCFSRGEGVIVRYKGREYGAFAFDGYGDLVTAEGVHLTPSTCTIRKGLTEAVDAIDRYRASQLAEVI